MTPTPLTDADIDAAQDISKANFRKSKYRAMGQQIMPSDSPDWWFAKQIESEVNRRWTEMLGKQEPVAWMYDAATYPERDLRGRQWKHNMFSTSKPYTENNMVRNLRPVFAYPAPDNTATGKQSLQVEQDALLRQALEALKRGRPQIVGVLVQQDQDTAIAAIKTFLEK